MFCGHLVREMYRKGIGGIQIYRRFNMSLSQSKENMTFENSGGWTIESSIGR